MSRIPTPASIQETPEAAHDLLEGVKKTLGSVPNLFRIVATSPAALQGYVALNGALGRGKLPAGTRERIALAMAEFNQCDYCLAAHSYLGTKVAKLSPAEVEAARRASSADAKADAAVRFAVSIARQRGHVSNDEVDAIKRAGFSDEEIVEVLAHVALNTLTNYVNSALETPVDFPEAPRLAA